MSVAITMEVLPASRGDCLWVECSRKQGPWRALIDGGMPSDWPVLKARIEALPAGQRHFDLVVVSHIDADHIGGMLPLFSDTKLGVTFDDVWFNGLSQLPEPVTGRTRSVAQGESLVELLSGNATASAPPWNASFSGRAVTTGEENFVTVERPDWPKITLLSPTNKRLAALRKHWVKTIESLKRGEPEEAPKPLAPLTELSNLKELAETPSSRDTSIANGSSIAFLVEHQGASCLLAGDAYYTVLGRALTALINERETQRIPVDAFKLPHHGSKGNVIVPLLELAPADHYIVSTNGDRFGHPDDIAIARVLARESARSPQLWFNYDNAANRRWNAKFLRDTYGHVVHYPQGNLTGVRLELPTGARH